MTGAPRAGAAGRVARWLAVTMLIAAAPAADAHAVLVRSAPPGRAAIADAPDRVQLWFNERLEPAYSSVSVWSATGAQVDRGDARVSSDDTKILSVTLGPLAPGTYTVRYRVLSVDGHIVDASFPFTIREKPAAR